MKSALYRRIARLEQQHGDATRRVHLVVATDNQDAARQIAELCAAGDVGPCDGVLCITGKVMVH